MEDKIEIVSPIPEIRIVDLNHIESTASHPVLDRIAKNSSMLKRTILTDKDGNKVRIGLGGIVNKSREWVVTVGNGDFYVTCNILIMLDKDLMGMIKKPFANRETVFILNNANRYKAEDEGI